MDDIDSLLLKLDLETIANKFDIPIRGAREEMNVPPTISNYKELREYAAYTYNHLYSALFSKDLRIPPENCLGDLVRLLGVPNFAPFTWNTCWSTGTSTNIIPISSRGSWTERRTSYASSYTRTCSGWLFEYIPHSVERENHARNGPNFPPYRQKRRRA